MKIGDTAEWTRINGDNTYRINYSLNNDSVVVDLGARHGEWCDLIRAKYKCDAFCFDVIEEYCQELSKKGYTTFNIAVSGKHGFIPLGIEGDEASVFHKGNDIVINSIFASEIFLIIKKEYIDLMKINVEGAEYEIIDNLIISGKILQIENLQVQFHLLEDTEKRYKEIHTQLSKTHEITWRFPFVWENWRKK